MPGLVDRSGVVQGQITLQQVVARLLSILNRCLLHQLHFTLTALKYWLKTRRQLCQIFFLQHDADVGLGLGLLLRMCRQKLL